MTRTTGRLTEPITFPGSFAADCLNWDNTMLFGPNHPTFEHMPEQLLTC